MKTWASFIREFLEVTGHTQQDLADKLGVSKATIAHWKVGFRRPSQRHQDQIKALVEEWNRKQR